MVSVGLSDYNRLSKVSLGLSADIMAEMSERLVVERMPDIFADASGDLEADALVLQHGGIVVNHEEPERPLSEFSWLVLTVAGI